MQLKVLPLQAKWVKLPHYHITLKFLGDTPISLIQPICDKLELLAKDFLPIETRLSQIGAFPNLINPKVIWIGIDEKGKYINTVVEKLNFHLQPLNFSMQNKPYLSHITLARVKGALNKDLASDITSVKISGDKFCLSQIALMESILTPQGPIYHEIKSYSLEYSNH